MLRFSDDFRYSKDHLWILEEEESQIQIGVTQVLPLIAGEPDEVEFMAVEGEVVREGQTLARLLTEDDEWEVVAPLSGTIVNFNLELTDHPESVTDDPYDEGWLLRMAPADPALLDRLLDANDYEDHVVDELAALEEDQLDDDDDFEDQELEGAGEFDDDEDEDDDEEEEEEDEDDYL